MSSFYSYVPGISLGLSSLAVQYFLGASASFQTYSPLQPPPMVFMIAWALQAVSLGFVGQGIHEYNAGPGADKARALFLTFSASLGPLWFLSNYLKQFVSFKVSQFFDLTYITGLLVLALWIQQTCNEHDIRFGYLMWPTIGWLIFALVLTATSRPTQYYLRK